MFGYISPRLDQLNEDQRKAYQACYCGLCRELGIRSGHSGRLTLSHDMTFLALLLSSLYEPEETEKQRRCVVHPVHTRPMIVSRMTEYAADMNLLLMDYKCEDHLLDGDRSAIARLGKNALRKSMGRIEGDWPAQAKGVREALEALWQEEKKPDPNPDLLCNLSGEMLGSVFVPKPEDLWAPHLRSVGEGLGRFVYWMDAWEDLDGDLKHHRYNPLKDFRFRENYEAFVRESLEMLIAEAVSHFEILPLEKNLDILRNVLYSGVWQRYYTLTQRKKKEKTDGQ